MLLVNLTYPPALLFHFVTFGRSLLALRTCLALATELSPEKDSSGNDDENCKNLLYHDNV
ncbi:MAG: hypothetical protein RL220_1804 [Bacteroidota bacterium]